jgi:carboxypeptidase C (cathepsin A)
VSAPGPAACLVALQLFTASGPAAAQAPAGAAAGDVVRTTHTIRLNGTSLEYAAHAGVLPIRDNDTGETRAHVFFVAYTVESAPSAPRRPLTFLWNGGPGANSTLVHLSGFGPRRLVASAGEAPRLEDNQTTWLDATDLVFVDPVGTGYSRATDTTWLHSFYSTSGDIASIAEFVRVFLTRFDAWDQPLYLGGESYGTWRAAGIAEAFVRRDIPVAGVILISGGIPVGDVVPDAMRAALFIPARATTALHHRKLPPELGGDVGAVVRRAEAWATRSYAPALEREAQLAPAERRAIVDSLAWYTGLPRSRIDTTNLVVTRQAFAEGLLGGDSVLARFDTRETSARNAGATAAGGRQRSRAILSYFREDLGFRTDLAYAGLQTGYAPATSGAQPQSVGGRWNYDQNPPANEQEARARQSGLRRFVYEGPPNGSEPWLLRAMTEDSTVRAFVAAGMYDSLNSCAFNEHLVTRLDPAVARRITVRCYVGGHMMYEDEETRAVLKADVVRFLIEHRHEAHELHLRFRNLQTARRS